MKKEKEKFDKSIFKKTGDELQEWLKFKRHGSVVEAKKGKGARYNRAREKQNKHFDEQ